LLVPGPVAALDVEDEAVLLPIAAARPAQVHPPEGGGVSISQGRYGRTIERDLRGSIRQMPAVFRKAHPGLDLIAQAQAFFFIGIDLVGSLRRHILQSEERLERGAEPIPAALAEIDTFTAEDGMQITAGSALLSRGGQHVLTFRLAIHRHDDLVDAIARAFVVDNGSGTEFGNGQEPGA
jgi:hypothetical protein